jgi:vacuolar iron transporter family protein
VSTYGSQHVVDADDDIVVQLARQRRPGPDELGSPWSAALSSLGAFAAGAVVVVLP